MNKHQYFRIGEFAEISCITRDNLIFYDKAGLLSPNCRGENGYRYYSFQQISTAYLISALRHIGMPLKEIKQYINHRTPSKMLELFGDYGKHLQKRIIQLQEIQGMMGLYTDMVNETLEDDIQAIQIKQQEEKSLFTCSAVEIHTMDEYADACTKFYECTVQCGLNINFPFGVMRAQESLLQPEQMRIQQFYLAVPNGGNLIKPKGRYVVGYMQGTYGEAAPLYARLLDYISENKLIISGNAYEDYPYNEISSQKDYLIRVMIPIG